MSEEQNQDNVTPEPEVKEERPIENFKAELARKNAEIERLRLEREEMNRNSVPKRDPYDIKTWTDQELKMLMKSGDANLAQYKDQAEDLLLERKVEKLQARRAEDSRREQVQSQLEKDYPEAMDNTSEFSVKMNQVMREYDLAKTPAGKLAAARIVAAEGKSTGKTAAQKEKDRVASLQANMTDGDRAKPVDVNDPQKKEKNLKERILNSKDTDHSAIGDWADSKGLREKFGKVWGH